MTTMSNWFLIGGSILAFLILVLGTAAVRLSTNWLINRREERESREKAAHLRSTARMDQEREQWFELVKEKDLRIAELNAELMRVSRDYGNAKRLMNAVKLKEA